MKVTRKGYYTIEGPSGELLLNPDGSLREVTTRGDCYEYVDEDRGSDKFTIKSPTREVEIFTETVCTEASKERANAYDAGCTQNQHIQVL